MDKNPVQMLANLLAEMTDRCIKAEQERDAQKERADRWYESWQKADEDLKATRLKLTNALADQIELREKCHAFIAEHTGSAERTRLCFSMPKVEEGEPDA